MLKHNAEISRMTTVLIPGHGEHETFGCFDAEGTR